MVITSQPPVGWVGGRDHQNPLVVWLSSEVNTLIAKWSRTEIGSHVIKVQEVSCLIPSRSSACSGAMGSWAVNPPDGRRRHGETFFYKTSSYTHMYTTQNIRKLFLSCKHTAKTIPLVPGRPSFTEGPIDVWARAPTSYSIPLTTLH
jgi:hypothetical protein